MIEMNAKLATELSRHGMKRKMRNARLLNELINVNEVNKPLENLENKRKLKENQINELNKWKIKIVVKNQIKNMLFPELFFSSKIFLSLK